jgi:hypothetical protein
MQSCVLRTNKRVHALYFRGCSSLSPFLRLAVCLRLYIGTGEDRQLRCLVLRYQGTNTSAVVVEDWFGTVEARRSLRLMLCEGCEGVEGRRGMDRGGWHDCFTVVAQIC